MTIEQMIVQYLYKNKTVTLQNIGKFTLLPDLVIPQEADNDTVLPENAIDFKYDAHAKVDEGLVEFIVENSKKIKSLAISDLESYILLNKQFINLGKAHIIAGLGTIQKAQSENENYTFTQATSSQVTVKEATKVVKEKPKVDIDFSSPKKETSNPNFVKYIIMGLVALLLLGGIGYGGYWIYEHYKSDSMESPITKNTADDNVNEINKSGISSTKTDTTIKATPALNVKDTNTFYVVIKEFQVLAEAQKRLAKLNEYGNRFTISTKDSITYKLKLPFTKPLSDTLRVKDSVNVYFGAKGFGYVELPQ